MSGFDSSRRHSATRRFSPPDSVPIFASHGGRRSASAAISICTPASAPDVGDDRLEPRLLGGERVEVGVGLGIRRVDLVELRVRVEHLAHPLLDRLAHRDRRIELRLLRQEADAQSRHRRRLALELACPRPP